MNMRAFTLFQVLSVCIVAAWAHADGNVSQTFAIRRESEVEYRERLLRMMAKSNFQGKPIAEFLPSAAIKEVFVPYEALNKSTMDLSDHAIRALFDKCQFISEREFRDFHLAPWKTLIVTTVNGDKTRIAFMLGATLGTVHFEDIGLIPFKCVE